MIRLSYYGGGHYDSIVNGFHHLDLIRSTPGEVEDANVARASQRRAQARNSSAIEQMTDREATEQATLDLVLQESRNSYLNAGYDDLETCLLLSLQSAPQQHSYYRNGVRADRLPPLLKEGSESDMRSLLSFPGRPASSGSAPAASSQHQRAASSSSSYPRPSSATAGTSGDGQLDGDMDLLAVQGDILRSVQEQSEQDFVDHAILLSSLSETTNAHIATADGSTMAEDTTGVDAYTQRAMELSALSEEEALELALRESLQPLQPTATTAATSSSSRSNHGCHSQQSNGAGNNASGINNDDDFQTEDDLLQAALQASLESHQHRSSSAPSSAAAGAGAAASYSINIGAPYAHMSSGGDDAEDMDEELMRAIEASLQN